MKQEHFDSHFKASFAVGMMVAMLGFLLGVYYLLQTAPTRLSPSVFAEADRNTQSLVEEGPIPLYILPYQDRGGDSFTAKRDAFVAGNSDVLELSEAELNAWLRDNFTPANDPSISERPFALLPAVPKVSLQEDYMQIIMDLTVSMSGDEHSGLFTALGSFEKVGNQWSFNTTDSAVASARVPGGALLANTFIDFFKSVFAAAPEYQQVQEFWGQVSEIELTPGSIRITR
ncbi:MAG: hypothetical protein ACPGN3_08785 [Opitutales bacterium]